MADNKMQIFTDQDIIPIENGGTGATTATDALHNLNGMSKLTKSVLSATDVLDTTLEGSVLVAISADNNAGLYNVLGGDHAYVVQYFYNSISNTSHRIQIAHGFINNSMATRYYNNGAWSDWNKLFTDKSIIPIENGGTGETTLNNFMKMKGALGDTNVDNVKQAGFYQCIGSTTGLPTNQYGILMVINANGYIAQTYFSVTSSGKYGVYKRTSTNSGTSWDAWFQIYTSSDTIVIPDGKGIIAERTINGNPYSMGFSGVNSIQIGGKPTASLDFYSNGAIQSHLLSNDKGVGFVDKSSGNGTTVNTLFGTHNTVPIANGGTGATTADGARTNLDAQQKVENVTTLELGSNRSSAGNAFIDFHSNKGTDYDARIIVNSNKILQLQSSAGVTVSDMNNGGVFARNIQYSTTDLTAGSSALTNGRIYLVYE